MPLNDLDLVISLTPQFWARFTGARLFMTGGTGFLGSWILQVFQRANDTLGSKIELVVLTRDTMRALQYKPHVFERPDTTLFAGNVTSFIGPVGRFDLCIHAASDVGDPWNANRPMDVFDSIVQGTRRMLDLCYSSGASRFLLTSSGAVYGSQPPSLDRITETYQGGPDPLQSKAAYANAKRVAEWLACAYTVQASQATFASSIARIFTLIGPGMPLNGPFAAGNFIRDALAGHAINIQGDGRSVRSYFYMADLCVWLLLILGWGESKQAYNVGSEHAVSIAELARQVADTAGVQVPINIHNPITSDAANTPALHYVPNTQKARIQLGLSDYTSLNSALTKTVEWFRYAA